MLRESHRALMANDSELREQLRLLKDRYRHDAQQWQQNFNELKFYYQGLRETPPAAVALVPESALPAHGQHHKEMASNNSDQDESLRLDAQKQRALQLQADSIHAAWGSEVAAAARAV